MAVLVGRTSLETNVFEEGNLSVKIITVEKSNDSYSSLPPKPLIIVTPNVEGTYPVLLFLPGTCLQNDSYSQLFQHISSHGFIVVAPQLYRCVITTSGQEEINSAGAVTNWLSRGLQLLLPEKVKANLLQLALSGHSRGGKAAFALALGYAKTTLQFSLLLGLDPVAGLCNEIDPKILTYVARSFNLSMPIAVIGTGLGEDHKFGLFPPCAPIKLSSAQFFKECKPPSYYFLAKDYGHVDMLDDGKATLPSCICVTRKGDKDPFRRCLGGIFVAFLRAYFYCESADLKAIVDEPTIAPITLDPVICYMQ